MTLAISLLAAWLTMAGAPETPVARLFRRLLIEAPAGVLNKVTRGRVVLTVLLAAFVGLVTWQSEADGIRLLSLMAPEIVSWVTMFEIATYIDVMVASITAASVIRFEAVRTFFGRRAPRPRSRRPRPIRSRADNDDGDRPVVQMRAA